MTEQSPPHKLNTCKNIINIIHLFITIQWLVYDLKTIETRMLAPE